MGDPTDGNRCRTAVPTPGIGNAESLANARRDILFLADRSHRPERSDLIRPGSPSDRLQAIDAPERGQGYGTKPKEHLSELVAGLSMANRCSGGHRRLVVFQAVERLKLLPTFFLQQSCIVVHCRANWATSAVFSAC
jgi:hypothetical protein